MKQINIIGIDKIIHFTIPEASREVPFNERQAILFSLWNHWLEHHPAQQYFPLEELLMVDWSWKDASNRTLPQRVDKILKLHGAILPKGLLGALGNHVRETIPANSDYIIDITKKFNWRDGSFGDEDSCLWHGRDGILGEMEKSPYFYAFRFFSETYRNTDNMWATTRDPIKKVGKKVYYGLARTWLYQGHVIIRGKGKHPIYVLFNSYGMPLREQTSVFASLVGGSFKQIKISNNKRTGGGLYTNGPGFIVGALDVIDNIEHFDFGFENSYDGRRRDMDGIATLNEPPLRVRNRPSFEQRVADSNRRQRRSKEWKNFVRKSKKQKTRKAKNKPNNPIMKEQHFRNSDTMYQMIRWQEDIDWPRSPRTLKFYWRIHEKHTRQTFYSTLVKMLSYKINGGQNDTPKEKTWDTK